MRGLIFDAVFIVLLLTCVCIWLFILDRKEKGAAKAAPAGRDDWHVEFKESESHPITSFYLVRGLTSEYFASVSRMSDDYDDKLFNTRAAADDECSDRNATLKALGS